MLSNYYEWIKTFHIVAMTSWMAGMFYLPRLYAYHAEVKVGSEQDKTFQVMESRLLRIIINPAMIATLILGLLLADIYGFRSLGVWFHIKMLAVVILLAFHGLLAKWRKDFVKGQNKKPAKFYKIINEVPVVFFIIIVSMVVVKPFEN
ncbi:MAG: protoporphyrinogen oxidase HemJ [Alphaproteobacteria bacterium]|jgi:putative membrane protein